MQRRNGAADLLTQMKLKQDQAFRDISTNLSKFSVAHNVFAVSDQRVLLLGRENSTKTGIAQTITAIAEKQAIVASLARQLSEMKISANSLVVASTVARLGKGGAGGGTTPYAGAGLVGSVPPLLLIRVYQDSVQSLVKYNADLE